MKERRLLAAFYDFLVYFIIPNTILLGLGPYIGVYEDSDLAWLLIAVGLILVFVSRDFLTRRSLGKIIFSLSIKQKNGCEWKRSALLLRNITYLIGFIEVIYILIGKERLGDKLFKTNVISTSSNVNKLPMYIVFFGTIFIFLATIVVLAVTLGTVTHLQ